MTNFYETIQGIANQDAQFGITHKYVAMVQDPEKGTCYVFSGMSESLQEFTARITDTFATKDVEIMQLV